MDEEKAPDSPQSLPEAPRAAHNDEALMVKPRYRKVLKLAAMVGAAFSAVLFVVLLATLLGKSTAYHETGDTEPFCCPQEALMVLSAINLSVDPCEDFYGHVCSRANSGDHEYVSPLLMVALRWSSIEITSLGSGSSTAGALLSSLCQSFWDIDHTSGNDVAEYATAIVQVSVPSREMNAFDTIHFLAQLSFKYSLPAVLAFNVTDGDTVLNIRGSDECFSDSAYRDMLPSVLEGVNSALNTSVSEKQLLRLIDDIAALLNTSDSRILSTSIEISPFPALSQRRWADILNDLVWPMHPNLTIVTSRKLEGVTHLLDVLANATIQPVARAYVALCAALKTRGVMEDALAVPGMTPASLSCDALDICELEQAFVAEVVNSPRLNDYVRALLVQIKENVVREAQRYPIFYKITTQEFAEKLGRLKLIVAEQIAVLDIPVPPPSEVFAADLLAARSYTFDVRKAKKARGIPTKDDFFLPTVVRYDNAIFLPSTLFALLAQNHRKDFALDVPVLAVEMAAQIWSFLLESSWPEKIRLNIENHMHCIEEVHFNGSNASDPLQTAAAALGLVSAVDGMTPPEWNVMKRVNNTEISLARLVLLMWAYNYCDTIPGVATHIDVNLAIRNSRAFRTAFGCSPFSPMTQRVCCLEVC